MKIIEGVRRMSREILAIGVDRMLSVCSQFTSVAKRVLMLRAVLTTLLPYP